VEFDQTKQIQAEAKQGSSKTGFKQNRVVQVKQGQDHLSKEDDRK